MSAAAKRNHAMARRALKLSEQGLTHRQIAEAIEKKPHAVKGLIALGQRLRQEEGSAT